MRPAHHTQYLITAIKRSWLFNPVHRFGGRQSKQKTKRPSVCHGWISLVYMPSLENSDVLDGSLVLSVLANRFNGAPAIKAIELDIWMEHLRVYDLQGTPDLELPRPQLFFILIEPWV